MPAGRPSKFTQEIADTICQRLSDGESLRSICRDDEMPSGVTVVKWLRDFPGFLSQYACAREYQADAIFDECLDIADEEHRDNEAVQRARLRIDTRKWMAAKLRPKKYGEKIQAEHTGGVSVVITGDDAKLL